MSAEIFLHHLRTRLGLAEQNARQQNTQQERNPRFVPINLLTR